jgi:hypothetical protein
MSTRRHIVTRQEAERLAGLLIGLRLPFTVSWTEGGKRSLDQNALFHAWMSQIAKATHDTPESVKADCHIEWGIPIFRGEDASYNDFIVSALGGRTRRDVKKMISKGYIPCTRIMPPKILSRYMDAVWRHYSPHVALLDPEGKKYDNLDIL